MLIVIIIVFALISFAVQARLKSKFRKYSKVGLSSNMSGREVAESMLRDNRIYDVQVTSVDGQLTDHYNPANKTVNLSQEVYYGRSAAAAAVAAHECGHAVQHANAYSFLELRSKLVPLQNVSASIMNFIFIAMMFGGFMLPGFIDMTLALQIIAVCYFIFTLFAFITLPVEFDASRRALQWIEARGIASPQEHYMAKDALKWAAMTYVVAAIGSLVMLLYYLMRLSGDD